MKYYFIIKEHSKLPFLKIFFYGPFLMKDKFLNFYLILCMKKSSNKTLKSEKMLIKCKYLIFIKVIPLDYWDKSIGKIKD